MRPLLFTTLLIALTLGCFSSCDPVATYYFKVENYRANKVRVIFTTPSEAEVEKTIESTKLITIYTFTEDDCIEELGDTKFESAIESFIVVSGIDTLCCQVPGRREDWEYIEEMFYGSNFSGCSGNGTYTFFVNDSIEVKSF